MRLPVDFHFSQRSLQDYVDCPRRFELLYILRLDWPALQSEPVIEQEQLMLQGRSFHQMIQQSLAGLPLEQIGSAAGTDLERWWQNYLDSRLLESLPPLRLAEYSFSAAVGNYRLTARYDLLAVEPGRRAYIVDWKTARQRPGRAYLAERLQTRVYPYLLVEAGARINGGNSLLPDQVEMIYWFAGFPDQSIAFQYTADQHQANRQYLVNLIQEIENQPQPFPLTVTENHCRFCRYRSFCSRGVKAGEWDDPESWQEEDDGRMDIDFEGAEAIEL